MTDKDVFEELERLKTLTEYERTEILKTQTINNTAINPDLDAKKSTLSPSSSTPGANSNSGVKLEENGVIEINGDDNKLNSNVKVTTGVAIARTPKKRKIETIKVLDKW
eukprot:Pgem_evm1s19512